MLNFIFGMGAMSLIFTGIVFYKEIIQPGIEKKKEVKQMEANKHFIDQLVN